MDLVNIIASVVLMTVLCGSFVWGLSSSLNSKIKIKGKNTFSAQAMADIANKNPKDLKPTIKTINEFIRMLAHQGDKYYWHYDEEKNLELLKKYYETYGFKVKMLKSADAIRISWEETEEAIDKDLIKYYNYEKEK